MIESIWNLYSTKVVLSLFKLLLSVVVYYVIGELAILDLTIRMMIMTDFS